MIGLIMIALPVVTVFAMNKAGIIRISHEQSDDIIVPEGEGLDTVEVLYLPEYLPKGYELLEQEGTLHTNRRIHTTYSANDFSINIFQRVSKVKIKIDNENGNFEKVSVNGKEGWYQEKEGYKTIVWSEGNYLYLIVSDDPKLAKDELVKISDSLKEKEQ